MKAVTEVVLRRKQMCWAETRLPGVMSEVRWIRVLLPFRVDYAVLVVWWAR